MPGRHKPARKAGVNREPRTWLGRALRGWSLDSNPLRRHLDRVETVLVLLVIAGFALAAPLAFHAATTWVYRSTQREVASQNATLRQVPAVLLQDPSGSVTYGYTTVSVPEAQAKWTAPTGHQVTGVISAPGGLHKGSTTLIWVDQSGHLSNGPIRPGEAADRAGIAGTVSIAALVLLALGVGKLGRYALDRRRLAAWDADWRVTGPLWTSRR